MKLEEFQDLLDTFGANPELWPDAQRETALNLLAKSDEAVLLHEEALMLDGLLAGDPAPAPSASAMTSLFEDVARHAEAEEARRADPVIQTEPTYKPTLLDRLLDGILRPSYVAGGSVCAGVIVGLWDVWLKPQEETFQIAEFVYSALPL